MRLGDLKFTDLYLGPDFADIKGLKGSRKLREPAPIELAAQLAELRTQCRFRCVAERAPEFSIVVDELMFRVTMIREVSGSEIFIMRPSTAEMRKIEEVGIAPKLVRQLMIPNLKGLVVLAGETGSGKTTTAAAILKARLDKIGGIAVTIEDPPEVNLNGEQGLGRCMQVRASRRTGGYKEHLVRSLRSNPDMILLGEVREEAAAQEVVEASLNGHLIVTTIHASGVATAIERLASLAAGQRSPEASYKKLAQGLRMVIWQNLEHQADGSAPRYTYEALSLIGDEASGARSKIATGKCGHLVQDIDQQMRKLALDPMGKDTR